MYVPLFETPAALPIRCWSAPLWG